MLVDEKRTKQRAAAAVSGEKPQMTRIVDEKAGLGMLPAGLFACLQEKGDAVLRSDLADRIPEPSWRAQRGLGTVYGVAGPGVDAAEFCDIRIAEPDQFFGCLLASVSAAAVDQDQLLLIGQFGNFFCPDGFIGDIHGTGNMPFAEFSRCADVQNNVIAFFFHHRDRHVHCDLVIGAFLIGRRRAA